MYALSGEKNSIPLPVWMKETDLIWHPHPTFSHVRIAGLTGSEAGGNARFALVAMTAASHVAEHCHTYEDDVLYILRGKAVMWMQSAGDIPLTVGSFLRIPAGVRHRPHSFSDDFTIFNTWVRQSPPAQQEKSND